MNAEEFILKLEANDEIERGYMLLPYIKVNEEESYLNTPIPNEPIFYLPIGDRHQHPPPNGLGYINNGPVILNDHNYHFNTMNESSKYQNLSLYCNAAEDNKIKKQQCNLCNKVLANAAALVRHYRIHTGEQPFQCQLCLKRFTQQSNLWKHLVIHTGERKFTCTFCEKKFTQRANMEKHIRIHTGEKPFVCPVCERGFTQRANLKKHQRTHTGEKPYACKYCSRRFAQLSNKQKHEILHKGIKPYSCPICLVAFTQQSNLKKHLLTHNNSEEVNTCKICNKTYFKRKNFLKHSKECDELNRTKTQLNFAKINQHASKMISIKAQS